MLTGQVYAVVTKSYLVYAPLFKVVAVSYWHQLCCYGLKALVFLPVQQQR